MSIRFGTEGWRGVIADDFTFANLEAVSAATALWLRGMSSEGTRVIVSYDRRFMSEDFARRCAEVMATHGIKVKLSHRSSPTPALSFFIQQEKMDAGVMITASHNPYRYNGFKVKNKFGGPISDDEARVIVGYVNDILEGCEDVMGPREISVEEVDFFESYIRALMHIPRNGIDGGGRRVNVDAMHGSGGGWLSEVLTRFGFDVCELRGNEDPTFGKGKPEPRPENLERLVEACRTSGVPGFALDGDADRIGAVDEKGRFIDSHHVFALLLRHLVENRGLRGLVVKTVTTTDMVDKLCRHYELPLEVTPVGFKHASRLMVEKNAIIAGEESGGIGTCLHVPERDGSACAVLLLEYMETAQRSLSEWVDDLHGMIGPHYFHRDDIEVDDLDAVWSRVSKRSAEFGAELALRLETDMDGFKFRADDGSWLVLRRSGTESLVRVYAESTSQERVHQLLSKAEEILKSY